MSSGSSSGSNGGSQGGGAGPNPQVGNPQPPGNPPALTPDQLRRAARQQAKADAIQKEKDRKEAEAIRIQDEAVQRLRDQLKHNRLAICVGSGVTLYSASSQATRLSWWGLMANALDYFEDQAGQISLQPTNKADLASARKILNKSNATDADREEVTNKIQKLLANRIDLETTWMRAQFQNLYKDYVDQHDILDALKELEHQGAMLLTTNYDDLLEKHCKLDALDGSDPNGLISYRRGSRKGIFHPHGYWRNAKHVVLSAEQYWNVKKDSSVQDTLKHVLGSRTVLFVGCGGGLADPNFGPLIQWVGETNLGTGSSHYILLQRAEKNPVTQLPLIHLRCESFDDISRFLKDLLDPTERREGLVSELPVNRERRRVHDWLAPVDQSQFLNDMLNLQGPNRFDRQVTKSQDVWQLNSPSRVRLSGEAGFGKTMFCTSLIQNTQKTCRLGTYKQSRDSLAYFFCATYVPYLLDSPIEDHGFNQFLRTVISQLCPPDLVFAPLRSLYTECTRYHPARLPTNAELQGVLFQILWHLDQPPAPKKGGPMLPGSTYFVIDELESLPTSVRDEYSRFIIELAKQDFKNFHLLVSAEDPVVIGQHPPEAPVPKRGNKGRPKKGAKAAAQAVPVAKVVDWHEITLDALSTREAMLEWVRDRLKNDPSLAECASHTQLIVGLILDANTSFRWVCHRLDVLRIAVKEVAIKDVAKVIQDVFDPNVKFTTDGDVVVDEEAEEEDDEDDDDDYNDNVREPKRSKKQKGKAPKKPKT
ncbi:SIR2-like domain-containing protein [Xylariaceae sp. AK1471]|nr:SIR2-like domain-containing protein [Xylariaceae sp. AK1471]